MRKILLIIIITFGDIGSENVVSQNNAFFCIIIIGISFWLQYYYEPFISAELNSLNFDSSLIMLSTIFLGLFSSICEDLVLQQILLAVVISLNIYFFLEVAKIFLVLKFSFPINDGKIMRILSKIVHKFLGKGTFGFLFVISLL